MLPSLPDGLQWIVQPRGKTQWWGFYSDEPLNQCKRFAAVEGNAPGLLSIVRDHDQQFWLIEDRDGVTPRTPENTVGGPFPSLDGACAAMLINLRAMGWRDIYHGEDDET